MTVFDDEERETHSIPPAEDDSRDDGADEGTEDIRSSGALEGILWWRDPGDVDRVFACPSAPRIARDEEGRPQLSLVVYGRKTPDGGIECQGGYAQATVELSLSEEERDAVRRHFAQPEDPKADETPDGESGEGAAIPDDRHDTDDEPPQENSFATAPRREIRIVSPPWATATVRLELFEGVSAKGNPSLMGRNRCALQMQFNADEADQVLAAWKDGLPGAYIEYAGTLPQAMVSEDEHSIETETESVGEETKTSATQRVDIRVRTTETGTVTLTLRGSLAIDQDVLESLAQHIAY